MQQLHYYPLLLLLLPLLTLNAAVPTTTTQPKSNDATSLLSFKTKADLNSTLPYYSTNHFCTWKGVQCSQQNRVIKLLLQDLPLGGVFSSNSLTLLDQLRVLSLQNLSLSGPIPDLSNLLNLKSLFLDLNSFSGPFPSSLPHLHRLRHLHVSHNNLSGSLPLSLLSLDRLISLNLNYNHFSGSLPPLNQTYLSTFNVSYNNFTGPIPVTPTFLRFSPSSFASNPGLCGEIIHRECHPGSPFFGAPLAAGSPSPTVSLGQNGQLHGVDEFKKPISNKRNNKQHKTTAVVIGFCTGVSVLIISLLCLAIAVRRKRERINEKDLVIPVGHVTVGPTDPESSIMRQMVLQESELEDKVKRMQAAGVGKSGSLVFCAGEEHLYTLDQLMRGSAELLGRGTVGTTYKAVLDNRLIVTVKRLDAGKLRGTCKEAFERHMESVGGLRHPNLVPLRAFFQGKDERLLVYDYQPNGSLLSLVHGSKSNRAKPLHWTSCLKIAEDIAQGLSYIHQAWMLVHGNLKSSNVLLGPDFEACVADYCLSSLAHNPEDPSEQHEDSDTTAYKAPELITTKSKRQQHTSKSDVYSFGILLLELLTGKPPSQLPDLPPEEMVKWVRFVREDGDGAGDNNKLEMLLEVAMACSLALPDHRPTMWQVLKMLQEIKEVVLMDDSSDPLDTQNFSISLS